MSKAAILIDGGYLLKRLPAVRVDIDSTEPQEVGRAINQLVRGHLNQLNEVHQAPSPLRLLFRTFYYDARPYRNKGHTPVDRRAIDYARTPEAEFRDRLHDILRQTPNLALRLGEVSKDPDRSWTLRPEPQKRLLNGQIGAADLVDTDFAPALRQKGVDMQIGLDIASIALKRQAETIVLVAGDADFVPAAKLARRKASSLSSTLSGDRFHRISWSISTVCAADSFDPRPADREGIGDRSGRRAGDARETRKGRRIGTRRPGRVTGERTDWAGRAHPRAGPGPRIVSLVPSITELLFDLGLGPFVAGRTTFCVHPREAVDSVPRVGGTKTVRLDRLRDLAPTHVIVNVDENRKKDVEAIESFAPHVIVTHPLEPDDNPGLYRLLGSIFGTQEAAERLAASFAGELAAVKEAAARLPPHRVLYLIWKEPWMTVSRDTYISRTLALVNWETAAHDPGVRYPEVALDEALFAGVDLVLLSSEPYPFKPEHATLVRAAPGGGQVPVALIDAEMVSWYGSRAIRGLRYLARFADRCSPSPPPLSLIMR